MTLNKKNSISSKTTKQSKPVSTPSRKKFYIYIIFLVCLILVIVGSSYLPFKEYIASPQNSSVQKAYIETDRKPTHELEALLEKNAQVVEKVLYMIEKQDKKSIEQQDGVAKKAAIQNVKIQELQTEIDVYKQQLSKQEKIQNPFFHRLSNLMLSLVEDYYKGDVSSTSLLQLKEDSMAQNIDESFKTSLEVLITEIEGYGQVLNSDLIILSFKALDKRPLPMVNLLVQENKDGGYFDTVKGYLSKWIDVKKIEDLGDKNPWVQNMYNIQNKISQRQYEGALDILQTPLLREDERLLPLIDKLSIAQRQQKAFDAFLVSYKKIHESHISK